MNYKFLVFIFCLCLLNSCIEDFGENFTLQDLPGYVAFNAPGNNVTLPDEEVTEADGSVTLTIESPTGTLSDITIEYAFSGSAEFGTDFNVPGASATGGTIVLSPNPGDIINRDEVDLEIELLMDGVVDGEKTLTVTLLSASNAEGTLEVGRGGTDFLKAANVIIADSDE